MFDLDKLFAEDNYLGLKNIKEDKVWYHLISSDEDWFDCYQNQNLKNEYDDDWIVQRIIRLNNNGEIEEVLFDRDKDMPKLMPEIKNGMIIHISSVDGYYSSIGIFVDGKVIYQNGGYDYFESIANNHSYCIDEIWNGNDGFALNETNKIWSKN